MQSTRPKFSAQIRPAQFSIAPSMEEDGFSIEKKKRTFVIELLSPVIMHWTTMVHNLDLSSRGIRGV